MLGEMLRRSDTGYALYSFEQRQNAVLQQTLYSSEAQ
jgi:hypothetical protein